MKPRQPLNVYHSERCQILQVKCDLTDKRARASLKLKDTPSRGVLLSLGGTSVG